MTRKNPVKTKTRKPAGRIEVHKSGVHGRGVYATKPISKGARIIEYTGKRILWENVPNDLDDPHTFLFGLDDGKEVIDPTTGRRIEMFLRDLTLPWHHARAKKLIRQRTDSPGRTSAL